MNVDITTVEELSISFGQVDKRVSVMHFIRIVQLKKVDAVNIHSIYIDKISK